MDDRELYQAILGLSAPWKVDRVELRKESKEVDVHVNWREATGIGRTSAPRTCSTAAA